MLNSPRNLLNLEFAHHSPITDSSETIKSIICLLGDVMQLEVHDAIEPFVARGTQVQLYVCTSFF